MRRRISSRLTTRARADLAKRAGENAVSAALLHGLVLIEETVSARYEGLLADANDSSLRLAAPHRRRCFGLAKKAPPPKRSGRVDLNHRPLDPQSSALTRLRYAPNRVLRSSRWTAAAPYPTHGILQGV
jgi:hypothetical protein